MKIKKKSIIIPAFALLIGASLAGSISGTVAWYQYSTRVNAAYVGVSGGTSGNLQIRIREDGQGAEEGWGTRLTKEQMATYLASSAYGSKVQPITSGGMDKDNPVGDFYLNPVYGQGGAYANNWMVASEANYIVLPLQLRYVEKDGTKVNDVDALNVAKDVYLSDLLIQADSSNTAAGKEDLSAAIRFHINAYGTDDALTPANHINRLISNHGGTTVTAGKLDLDGDGNLDSYYENDKYNFNDTQATPIVYGFGKQVAFSNATQNASSVAYYNPDGTEGGADEKVYSMVVGQVNNSMDIDNNTKEYDTDKSKSIGSTIAAADKFLNVNITIWVEGWQTFENAEHKFVSMWDEDFIKSKFNVGFEFAVDPVE